ncbi:MAG: energy-coupling factor ABC transporter ATP-binding protein [archaeon GB-1867-005]|nr:energy-coupling factor ABC transporter ATP-binding protein [Candidatus Culexmicrobium cathedralense]
MIELRNVSFRYPNGVLALNDVNLSLGNGVTAVLGPNAAGKTTLLKVLGLIYKPFKGEVIVNGVNFWRLKHENERLRIRREIVYVHEKPLLIKGNVVSNLMYGLLIRGFSKDNAFNTVMAVLRKLGLDYLAFKKSKELSAGEAQLISIIRAIVLNPRYLLIDEPTANLDADKRKLIIKLIKNQLSRGSKVIIATHDNLLADKLANNIVLMEGGKVVSIGGRELLSKLI